MTKRQILLCLLIGCLMCTCFACNYTKQFEGSSTDYGSQKDENKKYNNQAPMYGIQINGINNHHNKQLEFSQRASNLVGELPGVAFAIVILTERNAYTAIAIDHTATGTVRGVSETDNTGQTRGMYNTRTGSSYVDPNKVVTGTNSYYTKEDSKDISHILKQKIAQKLRLAYPQLLEVYISANRDVINRMNVYSIIARQGNSLNDYAEEFNQMAAQVWGTNRIIKQGGK